METVCKNCKEQVAILNTQCKKCGFRIVLEPEEEMRARYLRGPALGALLFTQGWTFGARLYPWFILSLVPVVGIPVLICCLFFGRRWSWKHGGWKSWEEFVGRMRMLDFLSGFWLLILITIYLFVRNM